MAQIREIKKRTKAVGTIQRITKTMQMIATAKFTAAVQRAKATKPYTETIRELVAELTSAAGEIEHPLIDGPPERVGRELLIVISSDRGLCGAYNASVFRTAIRHVRTAREGGTDLVVETSGKKAVGFFRFQKVPVDRMHAIGDKPQYEAVEAIASDVIAAFTAGEYDAVRVAYMRFESNARQIPELLQLLPLRPATLESAADAGEKTGGTANYEFSPSGPELLGALLPLAVKSQLFQAFNDAVVSEQIMRMVAMKAATENARDLKKTLTRDFNRARQAQITTELTEIIGGTAALE
ncbi:MAG: ATP synthase F1 subunit gamma [Phycisphaerales bacterium]|nr:ATP synthase F1 subunit gamma [Phycisphaerales bacterium]